MSLQSPSEQILPIPHIKQRNSGECLTACVAMVCAYLNVSVRYGRLNRTLKVARDVGTPFYNVRELESLKLTVLYRERGTLQELHNLLQLRWPCIISVQTGELPYWSVNTPHAVVAVGMSQTHIYLNDPALPSGPTPVPIGDFDLAWLAQNEVYAVLAP